MSEMLSVQAEIREKMGKSGARSLRRDGRIPVNIFGKDFTNISASIGSKEAVEVFHRFTVKTTPVEVQIGKDKHVVIAKDIKHHPVTDEIEHIDLMCVKNATDLRINIPIKVIGRDLSPGIKRGGFVNMTTRFLKARVHKNEIPSAIEVDVSEMVVGDTVRLEDLTIPSAVTPLEKDNKKTIIKLVGKRAKASEVAADETTTEDSEEGKTKEESTE